MKKGLRVAGILAMAIAIAHCGDSDVRVSTGPGFVPSPGTFNGELSDGGSITIEVGSIESVTFDCDDEVITETFTPPQEIESDGTFVLKFSDGGRQFRIEGQFRDNNTVDGVINDEDNECDVSYDAFRDGSGGNPTPIRTPTPGGGPTATTGANPTSTGGSGPTPTGGGGGPTFTPGGGEPTPQPTSTTGGGGDACPVAVEVEGNAGSQRVLDSGWTGLAHNATVVSDGVLTFTLDCTPATRPCGVCQVGGPIANLSADEGTINSQRCSGDPSKKCTTGGSECAGSGDCVFFFGAPLPLSAGGVSSCVVNQVNGAVSGTANIETGAFATTLNLTSRVALGPTDEPCPTCEGDGATNDGTAGGTCNGGARNGQACDVNGVSPIPSFGSTSLDCPPASFVSALSIPLAGSSGTETRAIEASSPACTGAIGKKCFCPAAGTQPTQPNACLDDSSVEGDQSLCVPVSGGSNQGECPALADTVCSPTETFRGCLSNNDCPVGGDTCVAVKRPCYLDNGVVGGTVTAIGEADPPQNGVSNPTFASLFCIPPVAQASINAAGGLPGLGRIELPLVSREILTLP